MCEHFDLDMSLHRCLLSFLVKLLGFHNFQAWGRFSILAGGVCLTDFPLQFQEVYGFHDFH